MTDPGQLDGKIALITGAAQGIGARFAKALAQAGAIVAVSDVADCAAVADEIAATGGHALAVNCDVTSEASISDCLEAVVQQLGGIDILVNNAALFATLESRSLFEIDPGEWDRVMAVNVRGPWLMTRNCAPLMRQRGGGSIINIATNRVWLGLPEMLHYDASKGAVIAMTKSMATALGDDNIRVNAVCPGLTMSENVLQRPGIEERAPQIAARRPLKRIMQPEDIVGAVLFLAGDGSALITGQSLVVDGGSYFH